MSPRDRILARRAKFVAAALASAGAIGCSSTAAVCLEPAIDAGSDGKPDTSTTDTAPNPCLTPALDSSVEDAGDTAPMPCLDPAPEDTGVDTGPAPCLKMPPPDAG
jgi:hypothetical protein